MINDKHAKFLTSILGDDIFQELEKSEISGGLYKKNTRTALDPNELRVALEIVPRTILSYLMSCLGNREIGETCESDLPFAEGAKLRCVKLGPDNYSGDIIKDGEKKVEFKHRSIPGIGLQILTTFELYDLSELDKKDVTKPQEEKINKLQDIIDERLQLHCLIKDVVDKRISERQAIDLMIKEKLNNHIESMQTSSEGSTIEEESRMGKKSKLKEFLERREEKRQEPIEMGKGEINCPDCDTSMYKAENNNKIKLCVCYGENMNKEIKFKKNEDGRVSLKFPKSFDIENVEMLLDAIKKQ